MLTPNLLDKPSNKKPKESLSSGYFDRSDVAAQKPIINSQKYYSTAIARKSYRSIDEIEHKARRNLQRYRRYRYQIAKIMNLYRVVDFADISKFLDNHQGISLLLLEAHTELRKIFQDEEVRLEIASDPDVDGYKELFAYIVTSLPAEDAIKKLNEFDEQWFLSQLDRTEGLFNFNLRFV